MMQTEGVSMAVLMGEFTVFFICELDAPPLGKSNLMGPKKSFDVKFFSRAFFGRAKRHK